MNKKMWIIAVALMLAVIGTTNAQQYEAEKNFKVEKINGGCRIVGYNGKSKIINIPPQINKLPVVEIKENAFIGKGLFEVTIPISVTSINNNAFSKNKILNITIGSNVQISPSAFDDNFYQTYNNCGKRAGTYYLNDKREWETREIAEQSKNKKITEPLYEADLTFYKNKQGGITITGYREYEEGISVIRDLVIPAKIQGLNVTEIEGFAFQGGFYAFASYQAKSFTQWDRDIFESVTIPSTVTSIGDQAFVGRGIKTLILPDSIRSIGRGAFGENRISSIKWPAAVTEIPNMVFAHNQLTSIDIPAGVTLIESGAFGGNKLTELTIPENVTRIEACAFADNMISKLTFSNSGKLKTIEATAFSKNRLKSVVLPEGLTEIITDKTNLLMDIPGIGRGRWADDISKLGDFFGVSYSGGILSDNPLVYIKIPSTFRPRIGIDALRISLPHFTDREISVVEWANNGTIFIQGIGGKIPLEDRGLPISDRTFDRFYESQEKKAGIYLKKGQAWVMGTQEEFDALMAERTK